MSSEKEEASPDINVQEGEQEVANEAEEQAPIQQQPKRQKRERKAKNKEEEKQDGKKSKRKAKSEPEQQDGGTSAKEEMAPKTESKSKRKLKEEQKQDIKTAKTLKEMFEGKSSSKDEEKKAGEGEKSSKEKKVANGKGKRSAKSQAKAPAEEQKKEAPVPEKVAEWKRRREEFVRRLEETMESAIQARESYQKCALEEGGQNPQDILSAEELQNLRSEFDRILQGENTFEQLQAPAKDLIVKLLAAIIDSNHVNLSALVDQCIERLSQMFPTITPSRGFLQDLITQHTERKPYGLKSKNCIVFDDSSRCCLWSWELHIPSVLPPSLAAQVPTQRAQRVLIAQKLKCLNKLVEGVEAAKEEKDLGKVQEEFQKLKKLELKEREFEEKEKVREQKKREKEAKEEDARKRREEERAKRERELEKKEIERQRKVEEKKEKEQERQERAKMAELEKKKKMEEAQIQKQEQQSQVKQAKVPEGIKTIESFLIPKKAVEKVEAVALPKEEEKKQVLNSPLKQQQQQNQKQKNSVLFQSECKKVQEVFQLGYKRSEVFGRESALRFFRASRQLDHYTYTAVRKKCISIEDSFMKYMGVFHKKSLSLTGRNPIKKDETVVDYEMSSEEEWNEQNGEDLLANDPADEEEEEDEKMGDEEEADFIVPDDYLSMGEMSCTEEEEAKAQMLERKQFLEEKKNSAGGANQSLLQLKPFVLDLCAQLLDKELRYKEEFKAVSFKKRFPILLQEKDPQAQKSSPIEDKIKELVFLAHGSFENKAKVVEEFNVKYPDCSKASIEKKLKQCFVKEKKEDDPKPRLYATEGMLQELELDQCKELKEVEEKRLILVQEEIQKSKDEAAKVKEEKKIQKQTEKIEKAQNLECKFQVTKEVRTPDEKPAVENESKPKVSKSSPSKKEGKASTSSQEESKQPPVPQSTSTPVAIQTPEYVPNTSHSKQEKNEEVQDAASAQKEPPTEDKKPKQGSIISFFQKSQKRFEDEDYKPISTKASVVKDLGKQQISLNLDSGEKKKKQVSKAKKAEGKEERKSQKKEGKQEKAKVGASQPPKSKKSKGIAKEKKITGKGKKKIEEQEEEIEEPDFDEEEIEDKC